MSKFNLSISSASLKRKTSAAVHDDDLKRVRNPLTVISYRIRASHNTFRKLPFFPVYFVFIRFSQEPLASFETWQYNDSLPQQWYLIKTNNKYNSTNEPFGIPYSIPWAPLLLTCQGCNHHNSMWLLVRPVTPRWGLSSLI